jgi:hypothetical protein
MTTTDSEPDAGISFPDSVSPRRRWKALLRYAVQAPSSHNTQPWIFHIVNDRVEIYPDRSRRLRIADRDGRELFVSLGCALENLLVAIEHFGYGHTVEIAEKSEEEKPVALVRLTEAGVDSAIRRGLFREIPNRFTDRSIYASHPIEHDVMDRLIDCAVEPAVTVTLSTDPDLRRKVEAIVTRANNLQFGDPAWRRELGNWVGKGLLGTSFLVSKVSQLAVTYLDLSGRTVQEDMNRLETAPAIGMIRTRGNTTRERIQAGQVLERLWLRATAEGLRLHPMNQALQIPETKADTEKLFGLDGDTAQIIFRVGHGTGEPTETPRRSVDDVLQSAHSSRAPRS